MEQKLMTMFARTPVCVGAGASVGAIDLPVMRERHTRIPVIPGSSVKGVLRDLWQGSPDEQNKIFGGESEGEAEAQDSASQGRGKSKTLRAGKLLVGEARVLAFPVRSARGMFAWVTSPLALERFQRDSGRKFQIPVLKEMECLAPQSICFEGKRNAVLEEYCFDQTGVLPGDVVGALKDLADDPVWGSLPERLAVISDEMFSYFVENACEIPARICIDDATGVVKSGALFYQEQVPSETLFYNVLAGEDPALLAGVCDRLSRTKVLQFGGDETIGLGYCSIKVM